MAQADMETRDIEGLELDLLLEAIVRRYGYDFRHYSRASLERRVRAAATRLHCATISALMGRVLHDPAIFQELLFGLSITVTEMFRDPEVYAALRARVLPYLATYPFIKVWHAGCATGEEAYSMAILIKEAGLAERTTIYATDFNEDALARARAGIYPLDAVREFNRNYIAAGGRASFADYYLARYDNAIMNAELKKRLTFARHNLVTDQVFGEMHLVLCRNVLIYFDRDLQGRVLTLFRDSLVHGGFLCLGSRESLAFSPVADDFETVVPERNIFRKKAA